MNRAALDDVELEYELHGDAEPVMLIHPGIFADWFVSCDPVATARGSFGTLIWQRERNME
jgi:hypothetical protein